MQSIISYIMDHDWICSYYTPTWQGNSRSSPDVFVKALGKFYEEYTDIKLTKVKFIYTPDRVSNYDGNESQHDPENLLGSWVSCPPESDEEVDKTFKYIQRLKIITETHQEKTPEMYEQHQYKIDISSFDELYSLIKTKMDTHSCYEIILDDEFHFNGYDYSEFKDIFPWYNHRNGANKIWVFGYNGVEFGRRPNKKVTMGVKSSLYFPVFTEKERNFMKYMQNILKIKFSSHGFNFYYKTDKGKVKSKKQKIIL